MEGSKIIIYIINYYYYYYEDDDVIFPWHSVKVGSCMIGSDPLYNSKKQQNFAQEELYYVHCFSFYKYLLILAINKGLG